MIEYDVLKGELPVPFLEEIRKRLTGERWGCLVGGSLRDYLLNREVSDWDLVMNGDPRTTAKEIADVTGSALVTLDRERGIYRVIPRENPQVHLDLARSRGTIEEDLMLRDFSINAIALDLGDRRILDPSGGIDDLKNKVIRACSDESINDDPLRILRAYRLSARFGFEIDRHTENLIREGRQGLKRIAGERIRDELFKVLGLPGAAAIFTRLWKNKVLELILPEMLPALGMEQNKFHRFDVFNHSMECLNQGELLIEWGFSPFGPLSDSLQKYCESVISGDRTRGQLIKLICFLHDVGKPEVRRVEDGILYYVGHHKTGKRKWSDIARRLKLSNREIHMGGTLILHHMDPVFLPLMDDCKQQKDKVYRFFRDTGNGAPGVLILSWADVEAGMGEALKPEMIKKHHKFSVDLARLYFEEDPIASPPRFIDGAQLIKLLGISPGPGVGEILEDLRRAAGVGEIRDKAGAREFLLARYGK